jgi:hypothetical protein
MGPLRSTLSLCLFSSVLAIAAASTAQEIPLGATFVCSGQRLFVENCNIRDTSDTSKCMVGHPDTVLPNGLMKYTYETRGDLKKLLPTCQQPSAQQLAAAKAFQQRQQDTYNANVAKADQQLAPAVAANNALASGAPPPPTDPQARAMNRCITSGRLPASCTGNALLGQFTSMITNVTQGLLGGDSHSNADTKPDSGPEMAGVFIGPGNWRIDFVTDGVLVNCAYLSPDGHHYKISFRDGAALVTLDTTPRPLVLTVHRDNTITAPGPVTLDGVIAASYDSGYRDASGNQITAQQAMNSNQPVYNESGQRITSNYNPGHTNFASRRVTCPALNLSTKGATVGIETMQTDLLKTMFGGDKGAPTPPGIRMHGIFAAPTGFSVQFFPESAILGCGPDAARAYPYTVAAEGSSAVIAINAPDHPLKLLLHADGSLDPGSTDAYQVHGRFIAGQNDNGDFLFGPLERSCNLAAMTPSKTIPSTGGSAASMVRTASATDLATLSTPGHLLGNATLTLTSGFTTPPGAPNPLAQHPYTLLRDNITTLVTRAGVAIPAGSNAYKVLGIACGTHSPDCQKIMDALKASAASAVRADATGAGTFPAVPPGTYYLMISTQYNNHALVWDHPIQLNPGPNALILSAQNATPLN